MIIAYYSFRFRLAASNDKFHFYNRITGVLGTLLFVIVYKVLIDYLGMLMLMASHITISVIIAVVIFAFLILYVIFQMARILEMLDNLYSKEKLQNILKASLYSQIKIEDKISYAIKI